MSAVHLSVVRAATVAIALDEDFDGDAMADLKLAINEAWELLAAQASHNSTLTCRFRVRKGAIQLIMAVASDNVWPVDQTSFGWYALTTLTDQAATWVSTQSSGKSCLHIRLSKTSSFPQTGMG